MKNRNNNKINIYLIVAKWIIEFINSSIVILIYIIYIQSLIESDINLIQNLIKNLYYIYVTANI